MKKIYIVLLFLSFFVLLFSCNTQYETTLTINDDKVTLTKNKQDYILDIKNQITTKIYINYIREDIKEIKILNDKNNIFNIDENNNLIILNLENNLNNYDDNITISFINRKGGLKYSIKLFYKINIDEEFRYLLNIKNIVNSKLKKYDQDIRYNATYILIKLMTNNNLFFDNFDNNKEFLFNQIKKTIEFLNNYDKKNAILNIKNKYILPNSDNFNSEEQLYINNIFDNLNNSFNEIDDLALNIKNITNYDSSLNSFAIIVKELLSFIGDIEKTVIDLNYINNLNDINIVKKEIEKYNKKIIKIKETKYNYTTSDIIKSFTFLNEVLNSIFNLKKDSSIDEINFSLNKVYNYISNTINIYLNLIDYSIFYIENKNVRIDLNLESEFLLRNFYPSYPNDITRIKKEREEIIIKFDNVLKIFTRFCKINKYILLEQNKNLFNLINKTNSEFDFIQIEKILNLFLNQQLDEISLT